MALSRRIARPLLASIFIGGGIDAVRHPAGKVAKATVVIEPIREAAGLDTLDVEAVVRLNGCVQVAAGLLLATGRFRRLACLVLMGSLIPTTYAGHRFWEETDEAARTQQKMQFLKNLGLMGGLILAAVDTEGAPSLGWRTKRRLHQVEDAMIQGRSHVPRTFVTRSQVSDRAGDVREGVAHVVQQATSRMADAATQLEPVAERTLQTGVEAATDALSRLGERLPSR